jgi:hypothetical protein
MEWYHFDEVAQIAIAALDEIKDILNNSNASGLPSGNTNDWTKGESGSAPTSAMDAIDQLLLAAAYI